MRSSGGSSDRTSSPAGGVVAGVPRGAQARSAEHRGGCRHDRTRRPGRYCGFAGVGPVNLNALTGSPPYLPQVALPKARIASIVAAPL
jgi:hypothetical protein